MTEEPSGAWGRFKIAVQRIPWRYWGWMTYKAVILIWMVRYVMSTPPATYDFLGWLLLVGVSIGATGVVLSIWGMLTSTRPTPAAQVRGPVLEVSGLFLLLAWPLLYAYAMLSIWAGWFHAENSSGREGPFWMAMAILVVCFIRIVEVWPRYWRPRRIIKKDAR